MTTDQDFGLDLACLGELDTTRTVTGLTLLLQAIANRLSTPRGSLLDDEDYGYDLREFVSNEIDLTNDRTLIEIQSGARSQALKDDRVEACAVTVTFEPTARRLTVSLRGTSSEGPFDLTLGVSALTVEILQGGPR